MNGFLPLVEAFVAFALTMMVLTTAVSVIVGSIHRLLRARAKGLRDTVDYLFRNHLQGLLENTEAETGGIDWSKKRSQFIVDITMRSEPIIESNKKDDEPDPRPARIETGQKPPGNLLERLQAIRNRWTSLKHGLDHLSEEDFQHRFDASEAGKSLKEGAARRWPAQIAQVTTLFSAYSEAATEVFTRRSRILTVACGFPLAILLNIDSFNLLSTYLTDPALRQAIVSESEEILSSTRQPSPTLPQAADVQEQRDNVTEALEAFNQVVGQLDEAAASIQATIEVQRLRETIQLAEVAERGLGEVQATLDAATEAATEIEQTYSQLRGMAAGLTETFPIGWDRFPNCTPATSDLRCTALRTSGVVLPVTTGFLDTLAVVWRADSAGFLKWLVGMLVTGALLGLGTPFWVRVMNNGLQALDFLRKRSRSQTGGVARQEAQYDIARRVADQAR
jgi:hypothetical protein